MQTSLMQLCLVKDAQFVETGNKQGVQYILILVVKKVWVVYTYIIFKKSTFAVIFEFCEVFH